MNRRRRIFVPSEVDAAAQSNAAYGSYSNTLNSNGKRPASPESPKLCGLVGYEDSDSDSEGPAGATGANASIPSAIIRIDAEKAGDAPAAVTNADKHEPGVPEWSFASFALECASAMLGYVDATLASLKEDIVTRPDDALAQRLECVSSLSSIVGGLTAVCEDLQWASQPSEACGLCDADRGMITHAAWYRCQRSYIEIQGIVAANALPALPDTVVAHIGPTIQPTVETSAKQQWYAVWSDDSKAFYYVSAATVWRCRFVIVFILQWLLNVLLCRMRHHGHAHLQALTLIPSTSVCTRCQPSSLWTATCFPLF